MSGGGGSGATPGLLPGTTLADLELAWQEREEEARQQVALGHGSSAVAMRLYALEIRVKTIICKQLGLGTLPRACKTHDLEELIIFTGLWPRLEDAANAATRQKWDLVVRFSKRYLNDLRYLPRSALDPQDLENVHSALDDPQDGVLAWLSRHP